MPTPWQFWIDVGGTFTDCIARAPSGQIRRHKVLSSGVTKGATAEGSTRECLIDPARLDDPTGFWRGYRLRLLDGAGRPVAESTVTDTCRLRGSFHLSPPLAIAPSACQGYELVSPEEAPLLAIRYLLRLPLDQPLPPVSVRLGTTRGTNALLTRRGAKTALVTTRGFADILHIGYQNRPRLFDLCIKKPEPLFSEVAEIDERITPEGEVLHVPDAEQIRAALEGLRQQGIESLAICLLNAYCQPGHEELVERLAREAGFTEISLSSRVAPLIKLVARGDTTVVDAYLNPILRSYVRRLKKRLGSSSGTVDLRLLTSAGGLVSAEKFVGKDSILSGPAGGVVGFSRVAKAAGFERAIGFDMGGTSTDVSRFDGRYELQYETEKAGVRVVAPMLAIETVAAGGGSICRFDGVKLVVGPDSAGADPGPACYGRGGPLTITDCNLLLGRILPAHFPFPLDLPAVRERLKALGKEMKAAGGRGLDPSEMAEGFVRVANANMARAIRSISVAKGYDPRDYVLVAFGGAAPQHACATARELGMSQILIHPDAGLLSALGIGLADVVRHKTAGVYKPFSEQAVAELGETFRRLTEEGLHEVLDEGVPPERIDAVRSLEMRYQGVDASLNIPRPESGDYAEQYVVEHRRLYGYVHENRPLEIVAARVEIVGHSDVMLPPAVRKTPHPATSNNTVRAIFEGKTCKTPLYERELLQPGDQIEGPAIIADPVSTIVIEPGWMADTLSGGELLLSLTAKPAGDRLTATRSGARPEALDVPDPVLLEIFNHQFAAIAEQMGLTLQSTSSSVNVKERLDFSCALFTAAGELVVNAPHIPVHLGAMGETVQCILADNPGLRPGDVFVTNNPYRGGSHLPDVTVVTPVHEADSGRLLFFTASRSHHAEIGGTTPGSMPPFSRNLAEEGVLIRNFKVVDAGQSRLGALEELLTGGPYPTRAVADNLADVSAQLAANQQGARDLLRLVERHSLAVTLAYMRHIQDAAAAKMRAALARLSRGRHEFVDHLDDGPPIAVAVTVEERKKEVDKETRRGGDKELAATIDFTGTGPVLAGNLNANRAIVTAAVMYALRCLIEEDIPLNQGVLEPVEIILPECLLNPPERGSPEQCAAVVGGNVETSQRVVDALLGALGVAAASQGTMNNVLFGDGTFGYYETICGGSGASAAGPGASAVHTHMTNTRLTDPEVLERRFPVRVREFSIRRDSGGEGQFRGGNGVVRRLEFLKPLKLSILSQRRGPYAPYGMAGGSPGALGRNTLLRADGTLQPLAGLVQIDVFPGDVLLLETPGGGGWGKLAMEVDKRHVAD